MVLHLVSTTGINGLQSFSHRDAKSSYGHRVPSPQSMYQHCHYRCLRSVRTGVKICMQDRKPCRDLFTLELPGQVLFSFLNYTQFRYTVLCRVFHYRIAYACFFWYQGFMCLWIYCQLNVQLEWRQLAERR